MVMNYSYLAELDTTDSTPALEMSLLRNCITAVELHGGETVQQIGMASRFHLKNVDWPHDEHGLPAKRIALVCRVEIEQAQYDAIKEQLLGGGIQLYVGKYPLKWAIDR